MKKTIINSVINKTIDWDKPQWLISNRNTIVLSTGIHSNFNNSFQGTVLPCENYPDSKYSPDWSKSDFKPLTQPLTITIEN